MDRTSGNTLKSIFFFFHYQTLYCLDLGNTADFMGQNTKLFWGYYHTALTNIFKLFLILPFHDGEFHNFFGRCPKISHAFPHSECIYSPSKTVIRCPSSSSCCTQESLCQSDSISRRSLRGSPHSNTMY